MLVFLKYLQMFKRLVCPSPKYSELNTMFWKSDVSLSLGTEMC